MSEDATAKELESLLRDALKDGLESPKGSTPLLQLRTVPIDIQKLPPPKAKVRSAAPPPLPVSEGDRVSDLGGLADKIDDLAPDSAAPKALAKAKYIKNESKGAQKKASLPPVAKANSTPPASAPTSAKEAREERRTGSRIALFAMGAVVLLAAGGAWYAHQHGMFPTAVAQAPAPVAAAPVAAATASEGAVGISVSRPATAGTAEAKAAAAGGGGGGGATEAKPEPAAPAAMNAAAQKAEPPPVVAKAAAPEAKAVHPVVNTKPEPVAKAAPPPPKPEPVAAAKPAPPPKPEPVAAAKPPAPAPAAPANNSSVDALLQQQLKGAIP